MKHSKKTLNHWLGVFFILSFSLFSLSAYSEQNCPADLASLEQVQLAKVVDGDSLTLTDGRKLRLVGVNTPELNSQLPKQKAWAEKAKRAVLSFFAKQKNLYLQADIDRLDRYGRELVHIYRADGQSLSAHLLAQGLGWQIMVPPNAAHQSCYSAIEKQARQKALGVWADDVFVYQADALSPSQTGFALVSGVVSKVRKGKSTWWLQMGKLAIAVRQADFLHFTDINFYSLVNQRILLKGWVIDRSDSKWVRKNAYAPFMMQWRHPSMLLQPKLGG